MYNLVHTFVGILKELGIITDEGARALSRELSTKILPSNPEDSLKQVEEAVKVVELKLHGSLIKAEPWLLHIRDLEARVEELEKSLTKKKA